MKPFYPPQLERREHPAHSFLESLGYLSSTARRPETPLNNSPCSEQLSSLPFDACCVIEVWARGRRGKTRPVCVDAFPFSYLLWLRFISSFGSFFLPFVVPFPYLFDSVFLLFGLHFLTFLGSSFLPFFGSFFLIVFGSVFLLFVALFSHICSFFLPLLVPFSQLFYSVFLLFGSIFLPSMVPFSYPI